MSKSAKHLKFLADHFEYRDWNYTRHDHIESIRYDPEHDPHNKISSRIKQAVSWLFSPTPQWMKELDGRGQTLGQRLRMVQHFLKRDSNRPDGVLDGGNIITFWEETGEYLNLMQPTVGTLVADFLIEDPTNPHAIKINKELTRLLKNYDKRIKAGEVE